VKMRGTFGVIAVLYQSCAAWKPQLSSHIGHSRRSRLGRVAELASSTGEDSWVEALRAAEGKDVKPDLWGNAGGFGNDDPARAANRLLLEWLDKNGVYISEASSWGEAPHPLGLSTETYDENNDNEASGRGLIARKGINDGDKLFSIPLPLCMTKAAARKELGKAAIPASTSEYIAIALLLCHERYVKGERSFWWPYINILPETDEVNPSYTWSEEELALLEGSPGIKATRSMMAKLRGEYGALLSQTEDSQGIFARNPQLFPGAGQETEGPFCFKHFEWAFTMLFSRAIRLERLSDGEAVALVPYADLINHSPFSTAYINAKQGEKSIFGDEPDNVVVFADRAFKKMEQVFISYGQKANSELLLLYGFSLDRNPFNSVEVSVGLQRDEADDPDGSLYDEKLAILTASGRGDAVGAGLTFPLYNDRYPNELLETLRLLTLRTEDVTRFGTGERVAVASLRLTTPLNDAHEELVYEAIVEACNVALDRYPTTEEDDSALMADRSMFGMLPVNSRNAIRLRRTEKRLLKRTIASTERRLVEIQTGEVADTRKPWLEPKGRFQGIIDEIGVDLK